MLLCCGLKNGTRWLRHFSEIYGFTRLPTVDKDTDFSYLLVLRCLSLDLQSWIAFILELYKQALKISARRGEGVIVSEEKNCVGGSCLKNWGLEVYLVKYGCHIIMKELFGIFFKELCVDMLCTLTVIIGKSV